MYIVLQARWAYTGRKLSVCIAYKSKNSTNEQRAQRIACACLARDERMHGMLCVQATHSQRMTGNRCLGTLAVDMLAINCTTVMGEVPPLHELVSYGTPSVRSAGTLHHLILVGLLVDDGLAHLWDEQSYGVVRHPPPIAH